VLKGRSGKTQEKTQAKVLEVYNGGKTNPYEIAEILGMNAGSVKQIIAKLKAVGKIKNNGRPNHNYKKRKTTDFDKLCDKTREIICDLEKGLSGVAIAQKYGVSRQWVNAIKKNQEKNKEQQNER
jgi:DNA-binding NarL/FixJ family response regulator